MAALAAMHDTPRQVRRPGRRRRPRGRAAPAAGRAAASQPGRRDLRLPRRRPTGPARCARLALRHQVVAVHVTDPRELELPAVGIARRRRHRDRPSALRPDQLARPARPLRRGCRSSGTPRIARAHPRPRRRVPAPVDVARLAHRHRPVRHPAQGPVAAPVGATAHPCPPHPLRPQRRALSASRGSHDDLPVRLASRPAAGPARRSLVAYVLVQRRRHTQVAALHQRRPARLGRAEAVRLAAARTRGRAAGVALVVLTLAFAQPAMAMRTPTRPRDDPAHPRHVRRRCPRPTSPRRGSRRRRSRPQTFVKNLPDGHPGRPGDLQRQRAAAGPADDGHAHQCSTRSARCPSVAAPRPRTASRRRWPRSPRCPRATAGKPTPAVIVLMSDGTPTIGRGDADPVAAADDAAADGQGRSPCRSTRSRSARPSGSRRDAGPGRSPVPYDPRRHGARSRRRAAAGRSPRRRPASSARSTTRSAATSAYVTQTRELTAAFAGAALLLALLRGCGSTRLDPAPGLIGGPDPRGQPPVSVPWARARRAVATG